MQVGCIGVQVKYGPSMFRVQVKCYRRVSVLQVSGQPNGFSASFGSLFFFLSKS